MDLLEIKSLKVSTRIGVHSWEQQINQTLLIDITIPVDLSGCEDNLQNTIDYDALCQTVTSFVESNHFHLIETVAEGVAGLIKQEFHLPQITVSVSKPMAIRNAGDIRVTIQR